ncbi:AAA family ATPase [Thioclava sp. 'Guangxiensis']|uniref:AAA family ATPase n=1 Tax=Thioclava sp. 'Guangxiensis' TaxID=3149044 RepID=UPI00387838AF
MTRLDPSLLVTKFLVEKDGFEAYQGDFKSGVNIISGANGAGKSTILNLLYYSLGGVINEDDWSKEALLCTRTLVEVEVNGMPATLARDISRSGNAQMEIFGGRLSDGLSASQDKWKRYPYARSANGKGAESFSQALFRLLDIPEVVNESSGKLTINQLLRLHYADQQSAASSLFKTDDSWDQPVIRDAVGRLICGSEETKVLENKLKIRESEKKFAALDSEMKGIFRAFGATEESFTLSGIEERTLKLEQSIKDLDERISQQEREMLTASVDPTVLQAQKSAYEDFVESQSQFVDSKAELDSLSFSVSDFKQYLASLERKLDDLRNSEVVQSELGSISFDVCPACFEPLVPEGDHACHLCKAPLDPDKQREQMVSVINELALQVRETGQVLERKQARVSEAKAKYEAAYSSWQSSARRLDRVKSRPVTEAQHLMSELQVRRGYLERELEDLGKSSSIARRVAELSAEKSKISALIQEMEDENEALEIALQKRMDEAYLLISKEIKWFLTGDLPRDANFQKPDHIDFDFGSNKISVNGESYFSASSRAVLKTSFTTSLMFAALEKKYFRHFRMCLIDTIEDKGMEESRSHKLQERLVERSAKQKVRHQIIFATSKLSPELVDSDLIVGKHYPKGSHTLNLKSGKVQ